MAIQNATFWEVSFFFLDKVQNDYFGLVGFFKVSIDRLLAKKQQLKISIKMTIFDIEKRKFRIV